MTTRSGIKIIALNGPPGSGKDTAGKYIAHRLSSESDLAPSLFSFATPLKAGLHALMCLQLEPGEVELKRLKDVPCDELGGMTYRAAYIALSEDFVKVKFGDEAFGHIAVNRIRQRGTRAGLYVITDSGFKSELMPLVRAFLPRNMLVMQIDRPGKSFAGDSRGWVDMSDVEGVTTVRIVNNMPIEVFTGVAYQHACKWLGVTPF